MTKKEFRSLVRECINEVLDTNKKDKPLAPAVYIGTQPGFQTIPDMDLFNLTKDIPGHPKNSTVSRTTLEKAGFYVPEVK